MEGGKRNLKIDRREDQLSKLNYRSTGQWYVRLAFLGIGLAAAWAFIGQRQLRKTFEDPPETEQEDPYDPEQPPLDPHEDCSWVQVHTGSGDPSTVMVCDGYSGGDSGSSDDGPGDGSSDGPDGPPEDSPGWLDKAKDWFKSWFSDDDSETGNDSETGDDESERIHIKFTTTHGTEVEAQI